jgi:hypothetical protein
MSLTDQQRLRLKMLKEDVVDAAVFAEKAREKLARAEAAYENELCKLRNTQ